MQQGQTHILSMKKSVPMPKSKLYIKLPSKKKKAKAVTNVEAEP